MIFSSRAWIETKDIRSGGHAVKTLEVGHPAPHFESADGVDPSHVTFKLKVIGDQDLTGVFRPVKEKRETGPDIGQEVLEIVAVKELIAPVAEGDPKGLHPKWCFGSRWRDPNRILLRLNIRRNQQQE